MTNFEKRQLRLALSIISGRLSLDNVERNPDEEKMLKTLGFTDEQRFDLMENQGWWTDNYKNTVKERAEHIVYHVLISSQIDMRLLRPE